MTASVGVLHTTEGTSFAGAEAAFRKNNSWPHLAWSPATNEERQYLPFTQTARALRNMTGGVQTNARESDYLPGPDVIQVEIIGFASETPNWPDEWKIRLALKIIEWSDRTGIPLEFPFAFQGNESYGLNGDGRISFQQWLDTRGWVGHQDVPENTHWDPGDIDWLPPLVQFFLNLTPQETPVAQPTITVDVADPAYGADGRVLPGKLRVAGWAYDPDRPSETLQIHGHFVFQGYTHIVTGIKAVPRDDVNAALGIQGTHGFDDIVDIVKPEAGSGVIFALDPDGGTPGAASITFTVLK